MGSCDSDDQKVNKLELCCEVSNNPKVLITPEVGDTEDLKLQGGADDKSNITTDKFKQSWDQHQTANDEVQIKQEVDSDSDTEMDSAYRIIGTFNVCEVKTFKREDEMISPDTETSLRIGPKNDINQAEVEVDNKANLDYALTNKLNVCAKDNITFIKENVHYNSLNSKDGVNKNNVHQSQSKGK